MNKCQFFVFTDALRYEINQQFLNVLKKNKKKQMYLFNV